MTMTMTMKLEPKEFFSDLEWGEEHYTRLQLDYPDMWVAIIDKRIVAFGKSLKNVEFEAANKTNRPRSEIPVIFVECGNHVY